VLCCLGGEHLVITEDVVAGAVLAEISVLTALMPTVWATAMKSSVSSSLIWLLYQHADARSQISFPQSAFLIPATFALPNAWTISTLSGIHLPVLPPETPEQNGLPANISDIDKPVP